MSTDAAPKGLGIPSAPSIGRAGSLSAIVLALACALMLGACAPGRGGSAIGFGDTGDITGSRPPMPRREYRGMWVASVGNIDWPSKPGLSEDDCRAEIVKILDEAKALNLNALFVQVRPACDALYRSSLEPWSYYLTGAQGRPTSEESGFDPLQVWIAGAHERGIELHAWINPFRARPKGVRYELAEAHIARQRPDLVREYDDGLWLDPGEPEAVQHSLRVLDEIVRNYDVDGVHFDDYFYPYPKDKQVFPDEQSYAKYLASGGKLAKDAWRRSNIDGFVQRVYDQTKRVRRSVRVSISPFGIWRPGNPKGVQGMDAYSAISADSRRWLCEGWVDMLIPQLYWKIDAPKQPYAELLNWWLSQNQAGRLLVVGNYSSRINSSAESWQPGEIVNQIQRTRDARGDGNVHFSAVALMQNRKSLGDTLKQGVYAEAALAPETPWLQGASSGPRTPEVSAQHDDERVDVRWNAAGAQALSIRAWLVQERRDGRWRTRVVEAGADSAVVARSDEWGSLQELSIAAVDGQWRVSAPVRIKIEKPSADQAGAAPTGRALEGPTPTSRGARVAVGTLDQRTDE